ncbi:hypothetical protein ACIBI9_02310 [Nonomuraea sp. NPDC050451]|uniref:hypothetical protein n=1 Tax=Nonomuraea sp. NPDC050451 TaxID=3364364 RepID=UPI0037B4C74A
MARWIYEAIGWYAHALDEARWLAYFSGWRRIISPWWLRTWLRTGGPIPTVRRRVHAWEVRRKLTWDQWAKQLDIVDTLDISHDAVRFRVRTRLDEYTRKWSSAHVWFDPSGRWGRGSRVAAGLAGQAAATWLAAAHWWGPMPLAVGTCVVAGYALVVLNNILIQNPVTTRGSLVAEWLAWLLAVAAGVTAWVTRVYTPGAEFGVWPDGAWLTVFGYAVHWLIRRVTYRAARLFTAVRASRVWRADTRWAILDSLVRLIRAVSDSVDRNDLQVRAGWIHELEWVAQRIEKDLPASLMGKGDSRTYEWAVEGMTTVSTPDLAQQVGRRRQGAKARR